VGSQRFVRARHDTPGLRSLISWDDGIGFQDAGNPGRRYRSKNYLDLLPLFCSPGVYAWVLKRKYNEAPLMLAFKLIFFFISQA
jgi:hypothetical protein